MSRLPETDPTFIFEHFRGIHATELLTAAVAHLRVFEQFDQGPLADGELRRRLQLAHRPFVVLTTALRAMGLLARVAQDKLDLSAAAREHLRAGDRPEVLKVAEECALEFRVRDRVEWVSPAWARNEWHGPGRGGVANCLKHSPGHGPTCPRKCVGLPWWERNGKSILGKTSSIRLTSLWEDFRPWLG